MRLTQLVVAAALTALSVALALAQKSQDTLRLGINDPFVILSGYHLNVDEASNFYRGIYQPLIAYDEHNKKWVPMLAKSWKRIDARTLEFDLRDDVTFHNGNKFDADDVVGTINFILDPATEVTFKQCYTYMDKVEKLGPYKVRFVTKEPFALDMQFVGYRYMMWDIETLNSYQDKRDYGRLTPVGTGPMKMVFMDKNKGVMLEAVDHFYGDKNYVRAGVKRVHGVPLPDRQTQIAQLLTGGIDMIRNASPDDAKELAQNPNLEVTNTAASNIFYVGLDSQGVSDTKLFTDPRVRRAVWMAIDRDAIVDYIVPGGPKVVEKINAMCFQTTAPSCHPTVLAPKFDLDGAKKLLAEAGYPNGIDYDYTVVAPQKPIAEAMAGSLLKAGIRAHIRSVPLTVYRKDQTDGKLQFWSILFPTGTFPDASSNLGTLLTGAFEPYFQDKDIYKLLDEGLREFDETKRGAIYQKAYDLVNGRYYLYPLSSIPNAYVHTKEVKVMDNPLMAGDTSVLDYG